MRIFQFAKWWWKRNDVFNRSIACYGLFWAIPCAIAGIWVGKYAMVAAIIGVVSVIGGWILYGIFYMLRRMWDTFNDEHPSEDIAIIRRLKGIPTPSKERDDLHEYY